MARRCPGIEATANRFLCLLNANAQTRLDFPDLEGRRGVIWRFSRSVASALAVLCLSVLAWPKGRMRPDLEQECDVLIISHLVEEGRLAGDEDFYFGTLASDMAKSKLKPVTALINHIKAPPKAVERVPREVLVLDGWNTPLAELANLIRLFFRASAIKAGRGAKPEARRFARLARAAAFDNRALGYLRVHGQLARTIRALRPSVVIHTFEGHGWERMVAAAAHAQPWPIKVFGYSHSVLYPGPRAFDFKLGHGRDPDHVFFPGTVTAKLFGKESEYDAAEVSVLGSPKLNRRAIRPGSADARNRDCCLIATQGEMDDAELMVSAMQVVAKALPETGFILRLHPLLASGAKRHAIQALRNLPPNIRISGQSLEHDLNRSRWLVYRGSSVVLNGLDQGLRPIYLNTDGSQPFNDPLPPEIGFRLVASSAEQVLGAIKSDIGRSPTSDMKALKAAQRFAGKYFTPLDAAAMIKAINRA